MLKLPCSHFTVSIQTTPPPPKTLTQPGDYFWCLLTALPARDPLPKGCIKENKAAWNFEMLQIQNL